jgi:hypothetical protein
VAIRPPLTEQVAEPATRGTELAESQLTVSEGLSAPVIVNVTEPVGVPVDGLTGATVAVKLTGALVTVGLEEDVTVVVVAPGLIVFEIEAELGLSALSPP